ncbi:transmembrane protein 91-like [Xenopus laevis]|nr:transmembrane protein 91-like [Xenopus laevis]
MDHYPKQMPPPDYNAFYSNSAPGAHFHQSPAASQHTVVINTQPRSMMTPQSTYKDYMAFSIASLICCCFPIAIAALIFSCKTREDLNQGDVTSAAVDSRMAFNLNMAALGVGIAIHVSWIIYVIYFLVVINSITSSYNYNG